MFWLLCGYMFLYVERPWEIWPIFEGLRIERVYMIFCVIWFLLWRGKQFRWSIQHAWVLCFLALHYAFSQFAFSPAWALEQGFEYFKLVVLYLLLTLCLRDERELQAFTRAFVVIMLLYVTHSFREFLSGRHVYRMGMVRMIGVDLVANDPNTFAASINYSLPFVWAVFKCENNKWMKRILIGYFVMAVVCIILTGSRSGFVTFLFFVFLVTLGSKGFFKKIGILLLFALVSSVTWNFIPSDKQDRIRSIWDKESAPAAKSSNESAMGRIEGLNAGLRMFQRHPLTGVGAGGRNFVGYRIIHDDGVALQAHNFIGEIFGEMGLIGVLVFFAHICTTLVHARLTKKAIKTPADGSIAFLPFLATSCQWGIALLLFNGIFGHNMYRLNWLLYAAMMVVSAAVARKHKISLEDFKP